MLESEPLKGAIHPLYHSGRGVVGIERACASGLQLLRGQHLFHLGPRLSPLVVTRVKDLRHGPPTHVTHEHCLLLRCGWSVFRFQRSKGEYGGDVLPVFLTGRAFSNPVCV